ncbi:MAG: alpha/beta hydrolase [Phycisphaeraceae bacterium]|nr:alpha/beta hydrolase [Phycisphaeraceae bacterium]
MREALELWAGDGPTGSHGQKPVLVPHLLETGQAKADSGRPCVLILPGGGYSHLAAHEGDPVAHAFRERGFHAAVLRYRVQPCRHPSPLHDVQRAVRMMRASALEWRIDPSKIAVLGFSAGGHLAASAANHYDRFPSPDDDLAERYSARPDASILCYAVLDAFEYAHAGSFASLLGPNPESSLLSQLSMPDQVHRATPPTFLWHTADDPVVPVGGALRYAEALVRAGVACEMHVFAHGRHGLGLALDRPEIASWVDMVARFLNQVFDGGSVSA